MKTPHSHIYYIKEYLEEEVKNESPWDKALRICRLKMLPFISMITEVYNRHFKENSENEYNVLINDLLVSSKKSLNDIIAGSLSYDENNKISKELIEESNRLSDESVRKLNKDICNSFMESEDYMPSEKLIKSK